MQHFPMQQKVSNDMAFVEWLGPDCACGTILFLTGQLRSLFVLFSFFSNINCTTVCFSGIWTRIVAVEGERADHLTTTKSLVKQFFPKGGQTSKKYETSIVTHPCFVKPNVHAKLISQIRASSSFSLCSQRISLFNNWSLRIREMEYMEHASFIEIYWSLVSSAHFMSFTIFRFLKGHNIVTLCRCWWIWCLFWNG